MAFACQTNDFSIDKVSNRFEVNKVALNNLVDIITRNNIVDTLFGKKQNLTLNDEDFPSEIKTKLISLEIQTVTRHYIPCYKRYGKVYIFKTDWVPNDSVFLVYNPCDTSGTKNRFYQMDKNLNETWGVGESWQILKIIKYLDGGL